MIDDIAQRLKEAGIDEPRREARLLVRAVTGGDPLLGDVQHSDQLERAITQRVSRVPLSKIIGKREFYGRDFIVTKDVLDPRPDSETLIDEALKILPDDEPVSILDLGTGSGCLLLTLLAERPLSRGVAVDISEAALSVARQNAQALGLADRISFVHADFAAYEAAALFDMVISNPPYIPSWEVDTLEPEVFNHDPRLALDGGTQGWEPYAVLFARMRALLSPGSHFLVELSPDICDKVHDLAIAAGHTEIVLIPDLAGRARVLSARCG